MNLLLDRCSPGKDATLGTLSVNGKLLCWTLEDTVREVDGQPVSKWKVLGATAIPRGKYAVIITYSNRFKRDMPLLVDVPGFSGIRIHPGNTSEDTEGCILVGGRPTKPNWLPNSRMTFDKLFAILEEAEQHGEPVSIVVK